MDTDLLTNTLNHTIAEINQKPEAWKTWGIGLTIVTLTAFAAPATIIFVPLLKKSIYEKVMSFLVALGVGALSGSIMFIMLPQAFGLPDDENPNFLSKSWIVLAALYGFFFVDRLLQYAMELKRRIKSRRNTNKVESCSSSSNSFSSKDEILEVEREISRRNDLEQIQFSSRRRVPVVVTSSDTTSNQSTSLHVPSVATIYSSKSTSSLQVPNTKSSEESEEDHVSVSVAVVEQIVVPQSRLETASLAYMIIIGSAANNFVDGMNNGVAFGESLMKGLSIGLACFVQQFPQELGTLAILVHTGLGFKKTLLLNLIPGALSYIGFIIGVFIDDLNEGSDQYVFSVSSGMYLYIFLGTLIPEIRENFNGLVKTNLRESLIASVLQASGISIGVVIMYIMAVYAKRIVV